jgi:Flp pilus assembly protein TadG
MNRLRRLRRDESGMSYVFVGLGFMAFLSASMLAIDVGMMMTARNQAQNSADAGALAGATALVFDNYTDRSASGPAVTNSLAAAKINTVMAGEVNVTPADVTFHPNPDTGEMNRVQVNVFRPGMATAIARFFGMATVQVNATAMAEASPANAMTCPLPLTIPDRWIEKGTPPWDPNDTFDMYDKKGELLPESERDVYIPTGSSGYTGYNAIRDKGMPVVLKAGNDSKISPSFYFPWAMPGNMGADDYEFDLAWCDNGLTVPFNYLMTPEPGNMVGPTASGIEQRILRDPTAYWDESLNKVVSPMSPSPRIVPLPLFDPEYYETGKQNSRNADLKAVNYLGFFIEELRGGEVIGRVTPIAGTYNGGLGPAPVGAFPMAIRLVK